MNPYDPGSAGARRGVDPSNTARKTGSTSESRPAVVDRPAPSRGTTTRKPGSACARWHSFQEHRKTIASGPAI
ncbi:hypothetical protein DAEQUDRAFT_331234 [Daedalea quercina L-15889]|uniref:Uncharacterized protein n=1 Tax=Daedalea quercina L-15889 TaxID=1314783 RepID=A0A165PL67_9APHY|nr:hypothetical protein DAEQUDRAFT_331234 [Daedalea quercina L-15889]